MSSVYPDKTIMQEINQLEKELKEMTSSIHSTPMPQLSLHSDSGIVTTKTSELTSDQPTTHHVGTPVGQFSVGIWAKPKILKNTLVSQGTVARTVDKEKDVGIRKIPVRSRERHRNIKVANYDGSSDWNDYRSHFEACASING